MEFQILGTLRAMVDGEAVALGGAQQRRLLAALVVHANAAVPVDRLVADLWPGSPPVDAAAAVHSCVSRLRGSLGAAGVGDPTTVLATEPPGYVLIVADDALDAARFEHLVEAGVRRRASDPAGAITQLDEALGLWRGDALEEFADADFARAEALRLTELRRIAIEERAAALRAVGRQEEGGDAAAPTGTVTFLFTDLQGSTRLWEEQRDVMHDALARHDAILRGAVSSCGGYVVKGTGDGVHAVFATPSGALDAAVAAQLALSAEPWPELAELRVRMGVHTGEAEHRGGDYYGPTVNRAARLMSVAHGSQILVSHTTEQLTHDHLPAGVDLTDLGEHQLRDLPTARIFQVVHGDLPARFPPLPTADGTRAVLPVPTTSFRGRHRELAALDHLSERPGTVTLVGPGGVGKTRLALEHAARVSHRYRDGARFIDLVPVTSDGVEAAVAAALGLVRRGRRSFHDSIVDWLARRNALLIIDNCEHVLAEIAPLVRDITRTSSQVAVLCTSRQPLGFPDEAVFPVEPLAVPDADAAGDTETTAPAVQLFIDRATASRHGLELAPDQLAVVAEVCRRLDGIPLAVELAASRSRVLSPTDLLTHLHPRSPILSMPTPDHPRHRTLLTTIEWSYDLLPDHSRALFERLSVFSGSWTADAATSICTGGTRDEAVLALADLADRSMVVADVGPTETRYRMLSTLRAFASDRLAEPELAALRSRHAVYYRDLAEAAEPGLRSEAEAAWAATVSADFANLHAAHAWAIERGDLDLDGRLLVALWNFGLQRLSAEYFRWVDEALGQPAFADRPATADLFGIAALGAWLRGDLHQSMQSCRSAFEAESRGSADISVPARMAVVVATAYAPEGNPAREPMAAEAPTRFLEVVEWSRARGDPWWIVYSMVTGSLGLVMAGDVTRALGLARRALDAATDSGCPLAIAWARFAVATALEPSDAAASEALLDDAVRGARDVDGRLVLGLGMSLQATLRRRLGRPLEAVPLLVELIDHWDRLGNLPQLWHTVREAAMCLSVLDDRDAAARLIAAVEGAELVMPLLPADRVHLTETYERLRDRLDDDGFVRASTASRESAVELASRALRAARDSASERG